LYGAASAQYRPWQLPRMNRHEWSAPAADLVLVSGDPLTDITAAHAIERIWRTGIAY
jgi:hypothetical protein